MPILKSLIKQNKPCHSPSDFFLRVRADRHGFGILTWKQVGTQKISTQNSKLVVSC